MKIKLYKKNILITIPVKKFKEFFGEFSSEPKIMENEETKIEVTETPQTVVETPAENTEPAPEVSTEIPTEPTPEVAQ